MKYEVKQKGQLFEGPVLQQRKRRRWPSGYQGKPETAGSEWLLGSGWSAALQQDFMGRREGHWLIPQPHWTGEIPVSLVLVHSTIRLCCCSCSIPAAGGKAAMWYRHTQDHGTALHRAEIQPCCSPGARAIRKRIKPHQCLCFKIKTTITKRPVRLITLEQGGISRM